jgi:hypothetical protein
MCVDVCVCVAVCMCCGVGKHVNKPTRTSGLKNKKARSGGRLLEVFLVLVPKEESEKHSTGLAWVKFPSPITQMILVNEQREQEQRPPHTVVAIKKALPSASNPCQ